MDPITLLLVDDHVAFLRAVTRFLAAHPKVKVIGKARDAEEALAKAALLEPQVIVLDLAMPGLSGLDAIPLLRERAPLSRIVVATLLEAESYRHAVFAAGADAFVAKSSIDVELMAAILAVAGRSSGGMQLEENDGY